MNGGAVTGNEARTGAGGGMYVSSEESAVAVTVFSGSVTNNRAATGGGAISLNAYASEVLYDNIVVYSIGTGDPVQPPTAGGEDEGGEEEGAPDTSDIMTGSIVLAVVALSVGVVASKKRFGR